jgi:hypothetical protein
MYTYLERIFKINQDKKLNSLNGFLKAVYNVLLLNFVLGCYPLILLLAYLYDSFDFKFPISLPWLILILFLTTILLYIITECIREQQEKILVLRWIVREFSSYLEPKLIDEIKFVIDRLGKEDNWMKDIKNGSYETQTKFLLTNPEVILNNRKVGYYRDDFISQETDLVNGKIKLIFKDGVEKIIDY